MLRKLMKLFTSKISNYEGFYPFSETCQIPKLSLIIEQYFGKGTNGTFIEVGAYDGEYVSNTSGLSDVSWNGIYFEPVPEYYERCKVRHANNENIRVVNTAVGDKDGELTMYVGGPISTARIDMQENFKGLD